MNNNFEEEKNISLEQALQEIKKLKNENTTLKNSLKIFKKHAYKTGEIYRIQFKNTNYSYIGKTVQDTKTRFLQHTRDIINKFLKDVSSKRVVDSWTSLKIYLGDDSVVLEYLFFKIFDKHDDYPFPSIAIKTFFMVPKKKKGVERPRHENSIFDYISVWRIKKIRYINEAVIYNIEGIQQEEDKKIFTVINKRQNSSNTQDLELNEGLYKVKECLKQIF